MIKTEKKMNKEIESERNSNDVVLLPWFFKTSLKAC